MMVDRRCVAKVLAKVRTHGLQHFRQHRRGRIIVEVDPAHHPYYSTRFAGENREESGREKQGRRRAVQLSSRASVLRAARDLGEPRVALRLLRRNNRASGSHPYQPATRINPAKVHRFSMATYRLGYSGPWYSARGRIRRLSSSCSITCAAQPLMRDTANTGVNRSSSMPNTW
jgi:hypothetical protein